MRIGHYHLNLTSLEAHKKFWVETLGGVPMKIGTLDASSLQTRSFPARASARRVAHASAGIRHVRTTGTRADSHR